MADHLCPWWLGYVLANPIRRLIHNPEEILRPFVKTGMTAVDVGCGMGFFTVALASLVGDTGSVIAVDLQERMLAGLRKRIARHGLADRVRVHRCEAGSLGIRDAADFILAFHMIHEVPDPRTMFSEFRSILNQGGTVLYSEPRLHVTEAEFRGLVAMAESAGLAPVKDIHVGWSRTKLLEAI